MRCYRISIKKYIPLPLLSSFTYHAGCSMSGGERQMSCDFTYMWYLDSRIGEGGEQRKVHRCREYFGGCWIGEEIWEDRLGGLGGTN